MRKKRITSIKITKTKVRDLSLKDSYETSMTGIISIPVRRSISYVWEMYVLRTLVQEIGNSGVVVIP